MFIGIDFDNTLTADADLWRSFIDLAKSRGHKVVIVTARRGTFENVDFIDEWLKENSLPEMPIYFTGLRSKVKHMEELGIKVDIWIEDDPLTCALGH
jgi:uncharacterized HAD superfamily protein